MVSNITSLTGNGLKDWLIQRVSAVYFMVYSLFLLIYLILHPHLSFQEWSALFHQLSFKIATLLAVLAVSLHAWVGIWTVITDYVKCSMQRLAIELLVLTWLLAQFIWCIMIVWGQ